MQYYRLITDFELMKNKLVKKGIPIVISEVGVLTEYKKELESIMKIFIYNIFNIFRL